MGRAPEFVEFFMKRRFREIDEQRTVKDAMDIISEESPFLVVTRNGTPKYILEDWKIWGENETKKIEEIEGKLEEVFTVPAGTLLSYVRRELEERTAIVIREPDSPRIIGTLSAKDLHGQTKKME